MRSKFLVLLIYSMSAVLGMSFHHCVNAYSRLRCTFSASREDSVENMLYIRLSDLDLQLFVILTSGNAYMGLHLNYELY